MRFGSLWYFITLPEMVVEVIRFTSYNLGTIAAQGVLKRVCAHLALRTAFQKAILSTVVHERRKQKTLRHWRHDIGKRMSAFLMLVFRYKVRNLQKEPVSQCM